MITVQLALAVGLTSLVPLVAQGAPELQVRAASAEAPSSVTATPAAPAAETSTASAATPDTTAAGTPTQAPADTQVPADTQAPAPAPTPAPADTQTPAPADTQAPAPADAQAPAPTPAPADAQAPADTQLPATAADGQMNDVQPPPAVNPNCTLQVPARPLSARGLATPYVLSGTGDGGACHETNPDQSAFVEATIVNPRTGAISVYHPLVVDQGTQPAVKPVVPNIGAGSVVGIWFGFNGDTLSLRGTRDSLGLGNCVNGLGASKFGQFAHCNAGAFFKAANSAIRANRLKVPPLGVGMDGMTCPSVRDFGVVDQDQSDNVTTTYLATADGRTAQDTGATRNQVADATTLTNGSDNRLLDAFVDPAIGCSPFTARDLTSNGAPTTSLALNELQAAAHQAAPVALIPLNNPMTRVDGERSTLKTNLYRTGVGQPPLGVGGDTGDPEAYCTKLADIGRQRLMADRDFFVQAPSPDAATDNLFDFLTQRLDGSLQDLGCPDQ